jgi:hypothetical protein
MACRSQDNGDCSFSDGKLLERITTTDEQGRKTIEKFVYNAQNQLDSIIEDPNGVTSYAFKYNVKNQLVERQIFLFYANKTTKARIDSLEYDGQNRLIKVRQFSIDSGTVLPFSATILFIYNAQNKIEKERHCFAKDTFNTVYEWQNDNIKNATYFDEKNNKMYIFSYKYDIKNNPIFNTIYTYDGVQSRNNIIESTAQDFSGRLDLIANPATHKFRYNASGFPTIETNNLNFQRTYCYK